MRKSSALEILGPRPSARGLAAAQRRRPAPAVSIIDGLAREDGGIDDVRSATLRTSLGRDLEWVLNSRRTPWLPAAVEIQSTLPAFGFPDLTAFCSHDTNHQAAVQEALRRTVEAFEPRLRDVTVSVEPPSLDDRGLTFHIDARLHAEGAAIRLAATLRPGTHHFRVEES